jgi:glycosyltransferase involved in cell wall biosynthesis
MKVLWLTQTPAGASDLLRYKTPGAGWIGSLQNKISEIHSIKLGICFFHDVDQFKFEHENVTYYPLKRKYSSFSGKIYQRLTSALYDSNLAGLLKVVSDFQPDIIHLFGTETGLGEVIKHISVPVIVHLQGLINPCTYAWFPKGISKWQVLYNSSLRSILLRTGYFYEYKFFEKRSVREEQIIRNGKYFFGRTNWDKNFVRIYNQQAEYIQSEEMLRPAFFNQEWNNPPSGELRIVTTVNPYLYKGLEIIFETAKILKYKAAFKFQWNVIGVSGSHVLIRLIEKLSGGKFEELNVNFLGALGEAAVISELLNANVYVHPSHIDNSPNSVCEAMVVGIPVLAGAVGGVSSIIENNKHGILFNSHDPFELTGRVLEYADDPAQLIGYAKEGKEFAIIRHDPSTILETVISNYQRIAQNAKRKVSLELVPVD